MWIARYGTPRAYNYKIMPSGKKITPFDEARIRKLCIPPKWINVRISTSSVSHIQVVGDDAKKRTQYIYHPMWNMVTNTYKYERMKRFAKNTESFAKVISKDLRAKHTSQRHELAIMFRVLAKTHLRVGNEIYKKENKTFGLTTLLGEHVKVDKSSNIAFTFPGKRGIHQNVKFRDQYFQRFLKRKNPGPKTPLFNSGALDMNAYLQSTMGKEFTCKDFRTYASNKLFLNYLKQLPVPATQKDAQKNLTKAYENVASDLGHTRAISKRSYVMPNISEKYISNSKPFHQTDPSVMMKRI